jgi:tetratricopeptide (TPR) repeat protein
LGVIHARWDQPEHAARYFRESVEIWKSLSSSFPEDSRFRQEMRSRLGLADQLHKQAQKALEALEHHLAEGTDPQKAARLIRDAEEAWDQALIQWENLATQSPGKPGYGDPLGNAHIILSLLAIHSENLVKAEEHCRAGLAAFQRPGNGAPKRPDVRQLVAYAHGIVASLLRIRGDFAEAREAYCKAVDLQQSLVADFPANADYKEQLITLRQELAEFLATCRDPRIRDLKTALGLAKKITRENRQDAECWSTLGVCHFRTGQWRECVAALKESLKLGEEGDATTHFYLAMALHQSGERTEARAMFKKGIQLMDKEVSVQPKWVDPYPLRTLSRRYALESLRRETGMLVKDGKP